MRAIPKSAAVVVLFMLSVSAAQAQSVNCNSMNENLQSRIEKAKAGAELFVFGHCDDGPYQIGKDLKIIGDKNTLLSTSEAGHDVLSITGGASVTIKNVDIDATVRIVGIHIVQGSSAVILNVSISGASEPAVNVSETSFARVMESDLFSNGRGVQVIQSSHSDLIRNNIFENEDGVLIGSFSGAALEGNDISDNKSSGVVVSIGRTYGSAETRSPANTIESNGRIDVECGKGGVFSANQPQISSTKTTIIDADCTVNGTIF